MTDETRPFAVTFARHDDYAVDVVGFTVEPRTGKSPRFIADTINAAVQARERIAAAKALRDLAAEMKRLRIGVCFNGTTPVDATRNYLVRFASARADAVERGTA